MMSPDRNSVVFRTLRPPPPPLVALTPVNDNHARPSGWPTAAILAVVVVLLSVYVWTLHTTPLAEATRIARTVAK